jgi:hypothetical protein
MNPMVIIDLSNASPARDVLHMEFAVADEEAARLLEPQPSPATGIWNSHPIKITGFQS